MEKIRAGDGKNKRLLVIDSETAKEMAKRVSIHNHVFNYEYLHCRVIRVKSQMNQMH